jgi:hypothetical protein
MMSGKMNKWSLHAFVTIKLTKWLYGGYGFCEMMANKGAWLIW